MKMLEILEQEMQQEALTTRKMLARIPQDKFGWQPHEKSMNIERLANHITELPSWVELVLHTEELDFAKNPYEPTSFKTHEELNEFFEKNLQSGLSALRKASEQELSDQWILRRGDQILSQGSKLNMIRQTFCQVVHHRAQLGVYLRLLDVPIPGSYGPSADEMP